VQTIISYATAELLSVVKVSVSKQNYCPQYAPVIPVLRFEPITELTYDFLLNVTKL
jgi:hypothetical protein